MVAHAKQVRVEVLPKQMEFLRAQEREVLYSGAFGAGKTRAVCLKAAMRGSIPGTREALCRKNLVTLKATTLRVLLEADGDLPPVLPYGSYTHNKDKKIIKIKNGGEIVYFGLDKESKIGSYNLTGCGVDEAVELKEEDWRQLRGRCRMKVQALEDMGLKRQIYGACNPGAPSHFLAQRFGLGKGNRKCAPNCRAVTTRSLDNWFLPKDYTDDLLTFEGVAKARYVLGEWAGSDGLVYDKWDRSIHVKTRDIRYVRKVVVGVDDGYTNPAVMLLILVDDQDNLHIKKEWYKVKQLEEDHVAEAVMWNTIHEPSTFEIDPSAAKLRAKFLAEGLPGRAADNSWFSGVQTVRNCLRVNPETGEPGLTVDPSCEMTIMEFESYEEEDDKPLKQFDHAMDAMRYAIVRLVGMWSGLETPDRIPGAAQMYGSYGETDYQDEDDFEYGNENVSVGFSMRDAS